MHVFILVLAGDSEAHALTSDVLVVSLVTKGFVVLGQCTTQLKHVCPIVCAHHKARPLTRAEHCRDKLFVINVNELKFCLFEQDAYVDEVLFANKLYRYAFLHTNHEVRDA